MCEWRLRRFDCVEDSLWDELFAASPQDLDGCAYALQQGDHTFTRLQHRINSTRRAFHAALRELERLEARDHHVVLAIPDSVSPATHSPQTQLQVLGSLRKNDSGALATGTDLPGEPPPRATKGDEKNARQRGTIPTRVSRARPPAPGPWPPAPGPRLPAPVFSA